MGRCCVRSSSIRGLVLCLVLEFFGIDTYLQALIVDFASMSEELRGSSRSADPVSVLLYIV